MGQILCYETDSGVPNVLMTDNLRWLLVAGAMSVILHAKRRGTSNSPWLADIIARKPTKVAAVALANKTARIVWALLRNGGTYHKPETVSAV